MYAQFFNYEFSDSATLHLVVWEAWGDFTATPALEDLVDSDQLALEDSVVLEASMEVLALEG
jgi:hypothetical protein